MFFFGLIAHFGFATSIMSLFGYARTTEKGMDRKKKSVFQISAMAKQMSLKFLGAIKLTLEGLHTKFQVNPSNGFRDREL